MRRDLSELDRPLVSRRLKAAREVRGISQEELGKLFLDDGLGKTDPGRIERQTMPFLRAHLDACVRHLRVPESWFTEDDTDSIVNYVDPATQLDRIEASARYAAALLREMADEDALEGAAQALAEEERKLDAKNQQGPDLRLVPPKPQPPPGSTGPK